MPSLFFHEEHVWVQALLESSGPSWLSLKGPTTSSFLKRISRVLHREDPTVLDLTKMEEQEQIVFLPGMFNESAYSVGPCLMLKRVFSV